MEFYLAYFDFVYDDPQYRVTDPKTGSVANARMTVAGQVLVWAISIDRGRFGVSVGPVDPAGSGQMMSISLLRQYVENRTDIEFLDATTEVEWARANLGRIEALFSDTSTAAANCDELRALRRANAEKVWGSVNRADYSGW